jgi:proteic killer suppression protein
MIRSFRDWDSERLHNRESVQRFQAIADQAMRRLQILDDATSLLELRSIRSNRLERLSGSRQGEYSIRINLQWRVCFRWIEGAPHDVEIVDYHD